MFKPNVFKRHLLLNHLSKVNHARSNISPDPSRGRNDNLHKTANILRGIRILSVFTWKNRVYGNFNTVSLTPLRNTDVDVQANDAIINYVN